MDIGRIDTIDQSKVNHIEKLQKVRETTQNDRVDPDEQYKNAQQQQANSEANEVILDNVKFGYNKETQDFFIKVTRGEAEYKYPTEDMMKMKAHLLELMAQQENN